LSARANLSHQLEIGLLFGISLIPFTLDYLSYLSTTAKLREKRHAAYDLSSSEVGDTMSNIVWLKASLRKSRNRNFLGLRQTIETCLIWNFKSGCFVSSVAILNRDLLYYLLVLGY